MSRFTLDTDPQFDQTLAELIAKTGGTKADVIRKAVATYRYLKNEDLNPENKISITDRSGSVIKDVILP